MTYHTRPQVLAYRTWAEEEPEVSADQESYRRDIVGRRLGPQWPPAIAKIHCTMRTKEGPERLHLERNQ